MADLEVYLPGPWTSVYGSGFDDLGEAADSLFGMWVAHHISTYQDLEKMLGLGWGGLRQHGGGENLIRVEAQCSAFPDQEYEGYIVCELHPRIRPAREEELAGV